MTRSVKHRFQDTTPPPSAVAAYVDSLRAKVLALAAACEASDELAWEHVITTYRPILYRAAAVLTGSQAAGRELADTLWSELYGVGYTRASLAADGSRRSLLGYFHSRSTLATWLRSVLAQRLVDVVRTQQRSEPLDGIATRLGEENSFRSQEPPGRAAGVSNPADLDRQRYTSAFARAFDAALQQVAAGDRLRLCCYYVQQLTLAEIRRLLGEPEATASRRLSRTRKRIREEVERDLRDRHRLTPAEIQLCYEYVSDDASFDVSQVLAP